MDCMCYRTLAELNSCSTGPSYTGLQYRYDMTKLRAQRNGTQAAQPSCTSIQTLQECTCLAAKTRSRAVAGPLPPCFVCAGRGSKDDSCRFNGQSYSHLVPQALTHHNAGLRNVQQVGDTVRAELAEHTNLSVAMTYRSVFNKRPSYAAVEEMRVTTCFDRARDHISYNCQISLAPLLWPMLVELRRHENLPGLVHRRLDLTARLMCGKHCGPLRAQYMN